MKTKTEITQEFSYENLELLGGGLLQAMTDSFLSRSFLPQNSSSEVITRRHELGDILTNLTLELGRDFKRYPSISCYQKQCDLPSADSDTFRGVHVTITHNPFAKERGGRIYIVLWS